MRAESQSKVVGLAGSDVPEHLAVIPDGNRRYASEREISKAEAHSLGADRVEDLLDWCLDLGIRYFTAYAFSTENFKRPESERETLMGIYSDRLEKIAESDRVHDNEVRLRVIGRRRELPAGVRESLSRAEEATREYDSFHLLIALGYGGRAEITDAVRKLCESVDRREIDVEDIDEGMIGSEIYAPDVPDPDLVIRTSGERRLSGFLLWRIAESRLHFVDKYWPEFDKEDLVNAIESWEREKIG